MGQVLGASRRPGEFQYAPKPYITIRVHIAKHHIMKPVPFLMDTGADETFLSSQVFGKPGNIFGAKAPDALGLGGKANRWKVAGATLKVAGDDRVLDITPKDLYVTEDIPMCLLGRDVLQQYDLAMIFDLNRSVFYLEKAAPLVAAAATESTPQESTSPAGRVDG